MCSCPCSNIKVVQASESLQEERAAAEAAFEAHALAAAQDWAQLLQGPLTVGLGEEARQELTQAHDEEMAVAASERVLVLAEMDAVARKTAQERDNKVHSTHTHTPLWCMKLDKKCV